MRFIPDNFYVGIRNDGMGFMTPTVKEGFTGRKKTVDTWCNGWHYDNKTRTRTRVPGKTCEVDNEFQKGFKIKVNNRRYSTDNVVWSVEHPKGFIFQISSENFCNILKDDTITNGTLKSEYRFVRVDTNNVLVKKGDPAFKTVKTQKEIETKVSTTKLEIGDRVTLKSTGDSTHIYLGAFHFMPELCRNVRWNEKPEFSKDQKTVKRHVFRKVGSDKFDHWFYTTLASPKVLSVVEKGAEKLTFDDSYEEIKASLTDYERKPIGSYGDNFTSARAIRLTDSNIIGVSKKATTLDNMKVSLIEIPKDSDLSYAYLSTTLLDTSGNNLYATDSHGLKLYNDSGSLVVYETDALELKSGCKFYVPVYVQSSGWRRGYTRKTIYSSTNRNTGIRHTCDIDEPQFLQLLLGE